MSEWVLVIAGGEWQKPLVEKARQRGFSVLVTDCDVNAPAFALADAAVVADVRDCTANLAAARDYQVCGVLTDQSDIAVPTAAHVAEALGLPGIGCEAAMRFTDKYFMRQVCARNGLDGPEFVLVDNPAELDQSISNIGLPAVVKPADSQSSRGVSLVRQVDEIQSAYASALENSPSARVLVEEYVDGPEFTVEGFKDTEQHHSLAVSIKEHLDDSPMVARRLVYSHESAAYDYDELRALNNSIVDALGLSFGITHAEYRYDGRRFRLIEVAARGGGTHISSHIVPRLSSVDVQGALVSCATGSKVAVKPKRLPVAVALDFFVFSTGTVREVRGFQDVLNRSDVLDAGLEIRVGDKLSVPNDDRSRHGYYIAEAQTVEDLARVMQEIQSTVVVRVD